MSNLSDSNWFGWFCPQQVIARKVHGCNSCENDFTYALIIQKKVQGLDQEIVQKIFTLSIIFQHNPSPHPTLDIWNIQSKATTNPQVYKLPDVHWTREAMQSVIPTTFETGTEWWSHLHMSRQRAKCVTSHATQFIIGLLLPGGLWYMIIPSVLFVINLDSRAIRKSPPKTCATYLLKAAKRWTICAR